MNEGLNIAIALLEGRKIDALEMCGGDMSREVFHRFEKALKFYRVSCKVVAMKDVLFLVTETNPDDYQSKEEVLEAIERKVDFRIEELEN